MSADGHLGSSDRFRRYQHIMADFSLVLADSSNIAALLQQLTGLPVALRRVPN